MKNKKGFTLVELLAVIVVLGIIMVIATTNVMKSIEDSKKKAKYIAAKDIVEIASAYMEVETIGVTKNEDDRKCVYVTTLIDQGYLEEDVTNPATGENGNIGNSQKVCTSSLNVQNDYVAKDGIYTFEGYAYYMSEDTYASSTTTSKTTTK